MTEYDNTNRGAIFPSHPDQNLIGQGRININGTENNYVVVMQPIKKGGSPEMVLYVRAGVLFTNDKRDNEKAPAYSGPLDFHPDKRVAAWLKEKDGKSYMSLSVSDKQPKGGEDGGMNPPSAPNPFAGANAGGFDDDIPF